MLGKSIKTVTTTIATTTNASTMVLVFVADAFVAAITGDLDEKEERIYVLSLSFTSTPILPTLRAFLPRISLAFF